MPELERLEALQRRITCLVVLALLVVLVGVAT
jgi:hypothetical protein